MSQKLPVNGFNWTEGLDESFSKSYNEKIKEGCLLEVGIQYPENLHNIQNDLPFLPKTMNIEKVKKLVANLHDKNEYVNYIRINRLVLKKRCKESLSENL